MFSDVRTFQSLEFIEGYVCIVSEVHKQYRKDFDHKIGYVVVSMH